MARKLSKEEKYRTKIRPNEAEKENGWDRKALITYVLERNHAAANRIFGDPAAKRDVRVVNTKGFNAQRWGRK
jgi:hypothetical protein